jgi:hypothetical protein
VVVPGLKDVVQGSTCTMSSRPRVLAGGIDAQEWNRRQTRERTHIDDVTSLLLTHERQDRIDHPYDSEEVRFELSPDLLCALIEAFRTTAAPRGKSGTAF